MLDKRGHHPGADGELRRVQPRGTHLFGDNDLLQRSGGASPGTRQMGHDPATGRKPLRPLSAVQRGDLAQLGPYPAAQLLRVRGQVNLKRPRDASERKVGGPLCPLT